MKAKFIINPSSGKQNFLKSIESVVGCLVLNQVVNQVDVVYTKQEGDALLEAREIKKGEYDFVVSVGGDGTLNDVVNGLMEGGSETPLAVISVGTANDFAQYAKPPQTPEAFCKMIMEFKIRCIDVGRINDRYFINQTATRIMDLTNQAIVNYIGDYDYYLEKKDEMTRIYAPAQETAAQEVKENVSETKLTWQQQKEEQALKRKRENELKKVEARIEELEARDKEIDETMVLPDICTNVAECTKLSREKAAIAEELEGLYEKWEELA